MDQGPHSSDISEMQDLAEENKALNVEVRKMEESLKNENEMITELKDIRGNLQKILEEMRMNIEKKQKEREKMNLSMEEEAMRKDRIKKELSKTKEIIRTVKAQMKSPQAKSAADESTIILMALSILDYVFPIYGAGTSGTQETFQGSIESKARKTPTETSCPDNSVVEEAFRLRLMKEEMSAQTSSDCTASEGFSSDTMMSEQKTVIEDNEVVEAKLRSLEDLSQKNKRLIEQLDDYNADLQQKIEEEETIFSEKDKEVLEMCNRLTAERIRTQKDEEEFRDNQNILKKLVQEFVAKNMKIIPRHEVLPLEGEGEEWRGAWGKVCTRTLQWNKKKVAVKQPLESSPEIVERFKRETVIISQLKHPNVTDCIGVVINDNGLPSQVIEYADRGSVKDYMEERWSLEPCEVLSFAHDVGQGVRYLHNLRFPIVHGDLHTGNFLIFQVDNSPGKKVKLCDFGMADILRGTMSPDQGTLFFNAQETATDRFTTKDDVDLFGVQLKWMKSSQLQKSVTDSSLEQLIQRCTAQKPEDRPDMNTVVDELERLKKECRM